MNQTLEKALATIAEKLNVSVDLVWATLLRQAPIDAVWNLAVTAFAYLALYLAYRKIAKVLSRDWNDAVFWVIYWVFVFIVTMVSLVTLERCVTALVNPEYWALMTLLGRW